MQPCDLIDTARYLVDRNRLEPRQADLKRAMSTAYYAVFHALCRNCADCLVGTEMPCRSQSAWLQAYRAVNHGEAKNRFSRSDGRTHPVMDLFPTKIQEFATCFVALQKKRHQADYDPEFVLTRYEVLTEITVAQNAIEMLNNSSDKDRTAFAVYTLLPKRKQ